MFGQADRLADMAQSEVRVGASWIRREQTYRILGLCYDLPRLLPLLLELRRESNLGRTQTEVLNVQG